MSVITRTGDEDGAHKWESDAKSSFTVSPAERDGRGTTIVLHLKDEHKDYASDWRLRELVRRYSDYIGYPIELEVEKTEGEGDDKVTTKNWEAINQARALWQRSPGDVTDEQYEEFYKHLTHDWEGPLTRKHFRIEGTFLFSGLLFVPKRPPFGLFQAEAKHGVRLHVKRVFIMDECEDLLPRWLRFVRGVIDSDDLPLNVSRELLQDSAVVKTMRKQVIKQSLDMLERMASADKPDADDTEGKEADAKDASGTSKYDEFWTNYGEVLKEGLHFEPNHKNRLAKLVRYASSTQSGMVSLDEYIERMPEGQSVVYYALGESKEVVEASPHLEALKKKGYEILFMTDPVDQWAVSGLDGYEDKKFVSAMTADLDLDEAGEDGEKKDKESDEEKEQRFEVKELLSYLRAVLQDKVEKVRVSDRLTNSPACLVIPEGGMQPHIERMLRAQKASMPTTKRIMEINPTHPLIDNLRKLHGKDAGSAELKEWAELLYEQTLLAEGSPIDNPVLMASRLTKLLQAASASA